jgi:hypothetical protein
MLQGKARAWDVAWAIVEPNAQALEKAQTQPLVTVMEDQGLPAESSEKHDEPESNMDDTLFLFISVEMIFIELNAISSLVHTRMAYPDYALVLANSANESGLSWLHYRPGIISDWRPEAAPIVTSECCGAGEGRKW